MSFSCDVNVLLYASDAASPVHRKAVEFLEQASTEGDLFCLGWPTVMSYLRISTHPGIFRTPLTPAQALGNIDALVEQPRVGSWPRSQDSSTRIAPLRTGSSSAATWYRTRIWQRCSATTACGPSTRATPTSGSSPSSTSAILSRSRYWAPCAFRISIASAFLLSTA